MEPSSKWFTVLHIPVFLSAQDSLVLDEVMFRKKLVEYRFLLDEILALAMSVQMHKQMSHRMVMLSPVHPLNFPVRELKLDLDLFLTQRKDNPVELEFMVDIQSYSTLEKLNSGIVRRKVYNELALPCAEVLGAATFLYVSCMRDQANGWKLYLESDGQYSPVEMANLAP